MEQDDVYSKIDSAIAEKLNTFNSYEAIYKPQLSKSQLPQERLGPRPNVVTKHKANVYTKTKPTIGGNENHIAMYPNLTKRASAIDIENIKNANQKRLFGDVSSNARGVITRKYEYDDRFYTNPQSVERAYVDPELRNQLIRTTLDDPSYKQKIIAESLMTGKTNITRPITDKSGLAIMHNSDLNLKNGENKYEYESVDFSTKKSLPLTTYELSSYKNKPVYVNQVDYDEMKKDAYGRYDNRKISTIPDISPNSYDYNILRSLDVSSQQLATRPTKEILSLLNQQLEQMSRKLNDDRDSSYNKSRILNIINSFRSLPQSKQLEILELHKEDIKRNMTIREDRRKIANKVLTLISDLPNYQNSYEKDITVSDKIMNTLHKLPESKLIEVCQYIYEQIKRFHIDNTNLKEIITEIPNLDELSIYDNFQLKRYIKKMFSTLKEFSESDIEKVNYFLFDQEVRILIDKIAILRKIEKDINKDISIPIIYTTDGQLIKLIPVNRKQGLVIFDNPKSEIMNIAIIDNFDAIQEQLKRINKRKDEMISQKELASVQLDVLPQYINNLDITNINISTFNLVLNAVKQNKNAAFNNILEMLKLCQYIEDSELKRSQLLPVKSYRLYNNSEIEDMRQKIKQIFNNDVSLSSIQNPQFNFEDLKVRKSAVADKYL